MANPTRQDIINAYAAVEGLTNAALPTADFCGDKDKFLMWQKEIVKLLPPKPEPTMAEIGWDNDNYYLAEAEHSAYGLVIMIGEGNVPDTIRVVRAGGNVCEVAAGDLTPTGHHYIRTA